MAFSAVFFLRRWFFVVDSLLIVTPIVGVCNCTMYCYALVFVHSSLAIISMEEEIADCFARFVFLVSRDFCVSHDDMSLSADRGIS